MNVVAIGDLVVVDRVSAHALLFRQYRKGTVLAIGSFVKKNKIHYIIKYCKEKNKYKISRSVFSDAPGVVDTNRDIIIVEKTSIQKPILLRQLHIPRVKINDTISLKNSCNVIVKYIGKILSMSLITKLTNMSLTHKDEQTLFDNSDDEIYIACEVVNTDKHTQLQHDGNTGGIINGIRYFYTDSNNKCILIKASNLTDYCIQSKYDILVYGYLSQLINKDISLHMISNIIQQYINKSIGFEIKQLGERLYSFGKWSGNYAVFDIDNNYHGPLIETTNAGENARKTYSTLIKGLYKFVCTKRGTDIESIVITKEYLKNKSININHILSDIANAYGVNEKTLLRQLETYEIKLYGINIYPIEELSEEFILSHSKYRNYRIAYRNKDYLENNM